MENNSLKIGVELTDEQLMEINGGFAYNTSTINGPGPLLYGVEPSIVKPVGRDDVAVSLANLYGIKPPIEL